MAPNLSQQSNLSQQINRSESILNKLYQSDKLSGIESSGFLAEEFTLAIHKTDQVMDVPRDVYKDDADDQESALLQSILRLETHLASDKVLTVCKLPTFGSWTSDIEMSMANDALKISIGNGHKADPGKFLLFARRGYGRDILRMLERDPALITSQSTDEAKDTALHLAARSGHDDTVKLLVRFILEERKGKLKLSQRIVRLFIPGSRNVIERSEMSVFQQNMQGDTPLHVAVENGHMEVASYLITKKPEAAYYYLNNRGFSPLGLAVLHGHQGLVQEVFSVLSVTEFSSKMRQSALHVNGSSLVYYVLRARNIAMLQVLLENVPDLMDSKDSKGRKPLSYAACKGYLEEVSYFLTKFPNYANVYDEDGAFPIHNAVKRGHLKIVAELLTRCPETMHQTNQELQTILHIAVRYSRVEVLTYMKNKSLQKQVGEIINSRDVNGVTFKDLAILMFPDKS